jgi:hypothetical protein
MGYVPGFEIDVFISYAHADDIRDVGEDRKWVEGFTDDLRKRLERQLKLIGKGESALYLWNDQTLERNRDLPTTLAAKLDKSAILMVILSKKYLNSRWCKFERDKFLKTVLAERSRSEAKSTVFLIKTDNIDEDDLPPGFTQPGYDFFIEYKQKGFVRRLHPHGNETEKEKYRDEFDRMSNQLIEELENMRSEREVKKRPPPKIKPDAPLHSIELIDHTGPPDSTIFVAKVEQSGNLPEFREKILERFADDNIKSIPQTFDQYPEDFVKFRRKMKQDLAQCRLFVQLLDDEVVGEDDLLPAGWQSVQYNLAKDMGVETVQWYNPQNPHFDNIQSEAYKKFLDECERSGILKRMSMNDFEEHVIRKIKPSAPPPTATKDVKKVAVMVERKDSNWEERLQDVLLERKNLSYEIIEPDNDPFEFDRKKNDVVEKSDGVIIVYGDIAPTWVRGQITVCEKARTRNPLYHRLAVCIAPPPPPPEPPPEATEKLKQVKKYLAQMKVLNWQCGFNEDELNQYLDSL